MSNYTKTTNFATKDNLSPGNPLKIVKGTEIDTEFNNIQTAVGTKTDNASAAITGGTITGITDLAVADGGTGASTASAALNNLLPSQTGNANKYLQTDGTNASWDAVSLSTSDITGTLPVANGGTGVTTSTGTGSVVLSNSPTLVTPALGTPASGTATNLTGLPISTGVSGLGTGVATFLGTPSSANLASAVTDETGSGALVFANSPTLVTPALGTPSALVGTNITGTASGLTAGNVTTNANLTGAVTSVGNATSLGSFSSANLLGALTDETGTGSAVFATSPTLVTPVLGTPTSATLTNATGLPLTTGVTGTLPLTNGGTGQTTANAAFNALAPSQATNSGKYLTTDGTNSSWATVSSGGSGTVTSVDLSGGTTGLTTSGGPVTTSGTITLAGTLAVANGGTGATNAATARTNLATAGTGVSNTFSANQIVEVTDNTNAALRVTQLGTGNSILVEDSANPDSTPFVVDQSGNVGIGTSVPNVYGAQLVLVGSASNTPIVLSRNSTADANSSTWYWDKERSGAIVQNGDVLGTFRFRGFDGTNFTIGAQIRAEVDGTPGTNDMPGRLVFSTTADGAATPTERVRIASTGAIGLSGANYGTSGQVLTSGGSSATPTWTTVSGGSSQWTTSGSAIYYTTGSVLVGSTTNSSNSKLRVNASGQNNVETERETTGAAGHFSFVNPNGSVGTIQTSGSSTLYNTSSDYRLKNTIAPMTGALAKVALLKPCTYKWNVDGADGEGFIAHELAEVMPQCVSGEKDAVQTYLDNEGNEQTRPTYQGIDVSFLVATLTAAIQEQQAMIASLKARLDAANL